MLFLTLLTAAAAAVAEPQPPQPSPSPKPEETVSVRVGGTIFTDYTFTAEPRARDADGNSIRPSAFTVTRAYVNVTGRVGRLVGFRITPDVRADLNDPSIDRSLAGSNVYRLKYAFVQVGLEDFLPAGSWARLGLQQTPWVDFEEGIYRYRFQGNVFSEREGFVTSSDYAVSSLVSLPHDRGDVHVGYYNGDGFGRLELNDQKAVQVRAAVRPFASSPTAKGLRLVGFADLDHYVRHGDRKRYIAAAFFEHARLRAGAQQLWAQDRTSGSVAEVKASGYSLWVTPISKVGLEGLARFDSLRPDRRLAGRKNRFIGGLAYWFKTYKGASTAVLGDLERVTYAARLARPDETRLSIHALVNF